MAPHRHVKVLVVVIIFTIVVVDIDRLSTDNKSFFFA